MSGKRKSESTISAAHEEKKPKDSQSIIVHSSGATSTKTLTTPTSVIQNSPQTLLNTATNSPPGSQQPKMVNLIKATPLQPEHPIPSGSTVFMLGGKTFCIPKAWADTTSVSAQKALDELKIECVEKTRKIQALKITKVRLNTELASTQDALEETRVECVENRSEIQALRIAKIKLETEVSSAQKALEESKAESKVELKKVENQ